MSSGRRIENAEEYRVEVSHDERGGVTVQKGVVPVHSRLQKNKIK